MTARIEITHQSVLVEEVASFVPPKAAITIDFTLGCGGHAAALLSRNPEIFLYGADRDPLVLEVAEKNLAPYAGRVKILQGAFSEITHTLGEEGVQADFILADLGVSSYQLDTGQRGFSFRSDGPLDMRMNPEDPLTAATIINKFEEERLFILIANYGEERFARKIAREIVARRKEEPFERTSQFADFVRACIPRRFHPKRIDPATKTFQALRMAVNDELGELERLLEGLPNIIRTGGRAALIAFHSLEDRLVKRKFAAWENPCNCPSDFPVCICHRSPLFKRVTKKPIVACDSEKVANPRSRSAKLRIAEKI